MADHDGWTACHFAARKGSYELVTYFADLGTDLHLKTNDGKNCLHIAALLGHFKLCKTFLDKHNFDVHVADHDGWTACHFAARAGSYELVRYFADIGTDLLLRTKDGKNCLHIAALYGHFKLCKTFVDKLNFNVHMADHDGWIAFHFAARKGSYELVRYFANMGTDLDLKTNDGKNCLHIAVLYGHLNLCKMLVEKYGFDIDTADNDGWAAIHFSARNGIYELVTYFTALGCNIHLKTYDGRNCLHIAALYGHLKLCKMLRYQYKFDVQMTDSFGWTALHFSARNGSYELVEFFAHIGTDINLKTNDGMDCLHIAALHGHLSLCKTLIDEYNFDIFMPDNDGWTVIHFSVRNGSHKLVRYFTKLGGDPLLKTNDRKNCLHIAARYGHLDLCKTFINNYNIDVHLTDNDECTPLHYSAESGSLDVFIYIFEKGSEIYRKTKNMRNVLHFSASNGHYDICEFILEHFVMDYEVNNTRNQYALNGRFYRSQIFYKYDIIFLHARDTDGNTYLHLAAEGNQAQICQLLLKYDTEVLTLLNKNNDTARDVAKFNGHKDVLNTLKAEYDREGMLFCFTEKY